MKKLLLILTILVSAITLNAQSWTLIEHDYVIKHRALTDDIFTATVGKYFYGYNNITQGDTILTLSPTDTMRHLSNIPGKVTIYAQERRKKIFQISPMIAHLLGV